MTEAHYIRWRDFLHDENHRKEIYHADDVLYKCDC